MNYRVSVVIPTYKRPHFLARAIDSVLAQTYKNTEVVVVDDNSPQSQERARTSEIMKQKCNQNTQNNGINIVASNF